MDTFTTVLSLITSAAMIVFLAMEWVKSRQK